MNVTGYEGRVPGLNDNQWSGKLILRDCGDGELAAFRQGDRAGVWRGPRRLCRSGLRSGTLVKRSNERERNPGTPLAKKICALLNKKRNCPTSNECYTKCGGFDKLNHRNANLLDSLLDFNFRILLFDRIHKEHLQFLHVQ